MKIGTKSLLFGAHQFVIHPISVLKAYKTLYGNPSLKEFICIFIHDWGYFGKDSIDGENGLIHPYLGAKLASKICGSKYFYFCAGHSRSYSKILNIECSKLCWADKLSYNYVNSNFHVFRMRLTGEMKEARELSVKNFNINLNDSDHEWFYKINKNLKQIVENNYKNYKDYIND